MPQLMEKKIIDSPIWSLVFLNGKEGIFSIGGTSSTSLRQVEKETDNELLELGKYDTTRRARATENSDMTDFSDSRYASDEWKWSKVYGAEGWWQILMRGIWVDGVKVLENQLIVLDVSL